MRAVIRSATPDDAEAIAHVHVEAWRSTYRTLLPGLFLDGLSVDGRLGNWRSILTDDAPNKFTFVAQFDAEIVGFATAGPERTNDPNFSGELYGIYLRDSFHGRGIGTALFQRSVESLQSLGMNSIKVWVLRDNPYRAFYERHGGVRLEEKTVKIAEIDLVEVAYGWKSPEQTCALWQDEEYRPRSQY